MFSKKRKQIGLNLTSQRRVGSLVDSGFDPVVLLAKSEELFDFGDGVVGESQSLKLPFLVELIDSGESLSTFSKERTIS